MGLRITILLSLALLTRICAAQETVTVCGRVTRSDSGAPVEDANVMLCRSDGRSVYRFAMIPFRHDLL